MKCQMKFALWRKGIERSKKEVEGKQVIPSNQTELRKCIGAIDNIYVLNYIINRRIKRKKKRLTVLFVNSKAAFDLLNREESDHAMKKKGIREGLGKRVAEIFR